jgi:hypothetical protein
LQFENNSFSLFFTWALWNFFFVERIEQNSHHEIRKLYPTPLEPFKEKSFFAFL